MRILFTGGGSGGHMFPLIAIIRAIRNIYPKKDLEFFYLGAEDEFGGILLSQEDVIVKKISTGKIRRYFSFKNFGDILFKIPWGMVQSFYYLAKISPHLVFSKGGSGSLPVVFCAKLFKIPIFIHESDIVPGLSNRLTSKWAKKIFISFPKTEYFDLSKTILVGNPVREEILDGSEEKARDLFSLTLSKPLLFFFGGSQGAEFINDFILDNLNNLLQDYEIIHLCGSLNFEEAQKESQIIISKDLLRYYHLYPFFDEEKMKHAYRAADLIIGRAGSGAIFEIASVGLPSILVPLPSAAADHQAKNAYAYAKSGAALIIEEANLTTNFFLEKLKYLFSHPEKMGKMKEEALRFSKPLAAKTIARHILEYLMLE